MERFFDRKELIPGTTLATDGDLWVANGAGIQALPSRNTRLRRSIRN